MATLEERCIWNILADEEKDIKEYNPLYKCLFCIDPYTVNNSCLYYNNKDLMKLKNYFKLR